MYMNTYALRLSLALDLLNAPVHAYIYVYIQV
jgi:hypothetical protein